MKYTFEKPDIKAVLDYPAGKFTTIESAEIDYAFVGRDLKLTIEEWYFGISSINELIDFLEAAKEKLSGINK